MNETMEWMIAAAGGCLLAVFYFGGLWWTLRRIPVSNSPLSIYFASLVVRSTVVLLVLYSIMSSFSWQTLAACLLGFMITRYAFLHGIARDRSRPDLLSRMES